ncbi:MAG: IS66 family insertion sequence element accessory protein TnpB [Candidatus Eremiobacteraeota bacterium]|nr:IS66 family insertion sequence element accessory protein TnpB [Candidatus Eremiobacteraeota bacterium]
MNLLQQSRRIFAYSTPVDMRKGFLGLEGMVRTALQKDPLSGDIFVFVNRSGTHLKCLLWDRTGFVIIYKRLEHGKFRFYGSETQRELDKIRFDLLLDGMKVAGISSQS